MPRLLRRTATRSSIIFIRDVASCFSVGPSSHFEAVFLENICHRLRVIFPFQTRFLRKRTPSCVRLNRCNLSPRSFVQEFPTQINPASGRILPFIARLLVVEKALRRLQVSQLFQPSLYRCLFHHDQERRQHIPAQTDKHLLEENARTSLRSRGQYGTPPEGP